MKEYQKVIEETKRREAKFSPRRTPIAGKAVGTCLAAPLFLLAALAPIVAGFIAGSIFIALQGNFYGVLVGLFVGGLYSVMLFSLLAATFFNKS